MAAAMANKSLLLRVMSASVAVANQAGKIIRDVMRKGDLGIVDKGINDLQTEADRSAQRCIINSLSKQFPKVKIIGEEILEKTDRDDELTINLSECKALNAVCPEPFVSVKEEDVVIWVDPLDGTNEFTQGLLDHVTVLIGIAVDGKAVGGVIHQPYYNYQVEDDYTKLGRTMWGIVGVGAYGIEHKTPPKDKVIVTTTRCHSNHAIQSSIKAIKPDDVLKVGGAGHKVLLLIEGRAHAYIFPSPGCKKWDTCAPEALLHSVGGKLTDIHGNDIKYHSDVKHQNSAGVLATYAASVHDWYLSMIPEDVKKSLI